MDILHSALEGMHRAEAQLEKTAARVARLPLSSEPAADSVDFSAEAIALIESQNLFATNAASARTADEVYDHLLDLFG